MTWMDVVQSLITVLATVVTAVATVFLWRVTRVLADETKRLASATSQPQVVAQLLPSPWSIIHADLVVENTGTGTAYEIEVSFDPPLEDGRNTDLNLSVPFRQISLLKAGQSVRSFIGEFHPHLDKIYQVVISWVRSPGATDRECLGYALDMTMFKNVSQLGASDPLVQLAEQVKKIREDWRLVASGARGVRTEVFTTADRDKQEQSLRKRWAQQQESRAQQSTADPISDEGTG